jgi:hypothetical protein
MSSLSPEQCGFVAVTAGGDEMKRQLRPLLAAVALLCAPLAWSQSSFPDSTQNTSSSDQQQVGSTDQPQAGATNQQQAGSTDPSQNGAASVSPSGYGDTQSGSGDLTQSGSGDQSQSGLGGPQATFSHPEKLPPLNLFGDVVSHTGLSISATTGESALYTNQAGGYAGYWESYSLFGGAISIVQARPTLMWSLSYGAGLNNSLAGSYGSYTSLNQSANGNVIWAFAKRWQLRVKDSYFYSDDPFQPFFTFLGQPTPNNPNPVYYFPQTVVEQNQGTVDLTYMLGAHDTLNFTGGESFQHYLRGLQSESSGFLGSSLWDSTTYSGGGYYQHQFTPQFSGGGGYNFTAMDFGHGQSRAGVQMFQLFANYKFSPRFQVSAWVGPELTGTKDIVPVFCLPDGCLVEVQHNTYFNIAEGGNFTWTASNHNSISGQFSHSVVNGGGIFGAVKYYAATATYSRPLTRVWNFSAGFNYSNSKSISTYQGDQYLYATQGIVSASRSFSRALFFSGYCAFVHETQNYYGLLGVPQTLSTSGVGFTLRYSWDHALGR